MDNTQKLAIAAEVRKYIETYELSQTDVANKSDVPKEYMVSILKNDFTYSAGKKKGKIADKYFRQLAQLIGFSTEKVYWVNRPTPQLTTAVAILSEAKEFGYTRLIVGETGWGKTHAIDLFIRKNPADVFKITVGSSDNLNDLIEKIVDVLKITTGKTKSKRLRDIAKKLKAMRDEGATPQIIFDEAEYMKQPALCAMKELYDALNQLCSIILIGTEQLLDNLDRLRKRNKNGIPQFYRRVKFGIRRLPTLNRKYTLFLSDIADKALVKFLQQNCDNYGELHDVMVPCMREADRLGVAMDLNLVKQVLNLNNAA